MTKSSTRLALTSTFITTAGEPAVRDALLRHLRSTGLRLADEEPNRITAEGGSQVVARLLGVWFASPNAYPRRVRITYTGVADGTRIDAEIEEALGVGYLDKRSRRNYDASFQAWLTGLGAALGAVQDRA